MTEPKAASAPSCTCGRNHRRAPLHRHGCPTFTAWSHRNCADGALCCNEEGVLVTGLRRHFSAWRDMDSRRRRFGFGVWLTGAEVYLGRRLYRVRWWAR